MTLLGLILSNLHCLLCKAAFPGTHVEASSLKTDINACQTTIHLQWAESWPGTWVLEAFWDTWLISLSNHLTVFLYLQDVNFVGCVCVPKYMCVCTCVCGQWKMNWGFKRRSLHASLKQSVQEVLALKSRLLASHLHWQIDIRNSVHFPQVSSRTR